MKKFIFLFLTIAISASAQNLPQDPPKMKLSEPLPANIFVELAKAVNPAVVNISTTALPRNNPNLRDPMLDLLEQLYGGGQQQMMPQQQNKPQLIGLGTGFIIRDDGLILTNNHVIAGADIINVQLSENSHDVYEATLVGRDERTDIALIKIIPKGKLPVAVLGSSKTLEVGDWVAAFGNPFGHGHSMTKGIISSKGREIGELNKIPLLQTDASINPGNSGGPLVNIKGQVIGVNSAIDARAQGIGFAIPIDEVKVILPQLESHGSITRGYIGALLGDLAPEAADYLGLEDAHGAVVTDMDVKGPAFKAGLKIYDIIMKFNGRDIRNSLDLIDAVSDAPIGKLAKIEILRNRKAMNLNLMVAARAEEKKVSRHTLPKKYNGLQAPFNLGFTVIDPQGDLRKEWNLPVDMNQPIVIETIRNSIASRAGLRVGDVILDVNKQSVENSEGLLKALHKGANTLRIARNSMIQIITLQAE